MSINICRADSHFSTQVFRRKKQTHSHGDCRGELDLPHRRRVSRNCVLLTPVVCPCAAVDGLAGRTVLIVRAPEPYSTRTQGPDVSVLLKRPADGANAQAFAEGRHRLWHDDWYRGDVLLRVRSVPEGDHATDRVAGAVAPFARLLNAARLGVA